MLSVCFRFGLPFVLYLERSVTWDMLQKEILEKMRHLTRPGVYVQVSDAENSTLFVLNREMSVQINRTTFLLLQLM